MIRIQLAEPDVDRLEQAFRWATIVSSATASRSVAVPLAVEDDGNEEAERSGEHLTARAECVIARSVLVSAGYAFEISLVWKILESTWGLARYEATLRRA
jgi:hypothetical protein